MRTRDVGVAMVGGCAIYVAMAACSAAGRPESAIVGGGQGTAAAGGAGGSGMSASSMMGPIIDPVPPAKADPVSGSRLKAKFRAAEDGSKEFLPYLWYDSELQVDCIFAVASDGLERCLPSAGGTLGYFLDATCTQPLAIFPTGCPPRFARRQEVVAVACGGAVQAYLYEIKGPELKPTMLFYKPAGGTCGAGGPPIAAYSYYALGLEMPASSFVAGTVQHE